MLNPFPLLREGRLARVSLAVKGKSCGFAPLTLDCARPGLLNYPQKGKKFFCPGRPPRGGHVAGGLPSASRPECSGPILDNIMLAGNTERAEVTGCTPGA